LQDFTRACVNYHLKQVNLLFVEFVLLLEKVMLHSPPFAEGWSSFFGAIRSDEKMSLSALMRETAIMSIAVLNDANYEWLQHEEPFLKAGGNAAMLEQLKKKCYSDDVMSAQQLVVLNLTEEMTLRVKPKQETMERAKFTFSNRELVSCRYSMQKKILI
jgi:hypothetical protein